MSVIGYDKTDGVATIGFKWASSGEGPTPQDEGELARVVSDFSRDPTCHVAVLTGSGDTFCGEWTDSDTMVSEARDGFSSFARVYPFSGDLEKPVIAAINGLARGRGLELALDCDIRLAAESAVLSLPPAEHDRRLIYVAQVLPRLVPFGDAMRLLLSDEPVTAQEAKRIGLVQDVLPEDRLMDEAMVLARAIAKIWLPGLTATKKVGLFWRNLMLNQHYELARSLMRSIDAKRG